MRKIFITITAVLCSVCTARQAQNPPVTPAWAFAHIVWEDSINTTVGVNK